VIAVPPNEMMFRVSGGRNPEIFLESGRETLDDFRKGLEHIGMQIDQFASILDFGCGCGRVMRWLVEVVPAERVFGTDFDKAAIEWLHDNFKKTTCFVNSALPPTEFTDDFFDLILGYSVFTHFDRAYQDKWLSELKRIVKPNGIVLLTVHGAYNWEYTRANVLLGAQNTETIGEELHKSGFAFSKHDGWDAHFPDFYHTAWHLPAYINAHWSKWFDVVALIEQGGRPTQDLVILRCPSAKGGR
jgi:cyclopropane fatty-acyl-phospholipid synthase-like methyltransferase